MKNRKLLLIVSLVLALTMSLGGTLAYLQDSDADVNVMTLGSVTITQNEHQRAKDENGAYVIKEIEGKKSYVLEVYENDKPLLPIVGDPNEPGDSPAFAGWDENATVRMSQIGSYGGMNVFAGKNAQDKFVTVTNTGKSDAYVRTYVAIEVGSTENKNPHAEGKALVMTSSRAVKDADVGTDKDDKAPWIVTGLGIIEINGNKYQVSEYLYRGANDVNRHVNGVLPNGDTTYPSLCQVYVKHQATNEDLQNLDGNKNGKLDILVLSQAIQADGFDDAKTALDTGFGKASDKVAEWFGELYNEDGSVNEDKIGTPGDKWPSNDVPGTWVSTADELVAALEAGEDVALTGDVNISPANMSNAYGKTGINVKNGQTIDGNGQTLSVTGATGTWDSAINTTGGTIKNLTIAAGFRGIFVNHNSTEQSKVVLENVTVDGPVYTISCDQGTGKGLTATNSTFNGWTSYAATIGDVVFNNCNFGAGAGYNFSRPYAPTTYVNCNFAEGHQIDPRAAVTFENCTIGGKALTAENLATLVVDNIANASVK